MHTQKSFFYYNTCFTGLLSSGSHNFIFYVIVFINNHIPPNSTLILFHYFYLIFLFAQLLTWPCILPFSTSLVHPGRLASSSRGSPSIDHRLACPITIPPTVSLTGGAASIVNMAHDVKLGCRQWSSRDLPPPPLALHAVSTLPCGALDILASGIPPATKAKTIHAKGDYGNNHISLAGLLFFPEKLNSLLCWLLTPVLPEPSSLVLNIWFSCLLPSPRFYLISCWIIVLVLLYWFELWVHPIDCALLTIGIRGQSILGVA